LFGAFNRVKQWRCDGQRLLRERCGAFSGFHPVGYGDRRERAGFVGPQNAGLCAGGIDEVELFDKFWRSGQRRVCGPCGLCVVLKEADCVCDVVIEARCEEGSGEVDVFAFALQVCGEHAFRPSVLHKRYDAEECGERDADGDESSEAETQVHGRGL